MTEKPQILYADDTPDDRELVALYFERKGWTVELASSPNEMIEKINTRIAETGTNFDALLVDINFFGQKDTPRKTGISAVADIRATDSKVPVIFISAYVNTLMREQISAVGGEVMQKPTDLEDLYILTVLAINQFRRKSAFEADETAHLVKPLVILDEAINEVRNNVGDLYGKTK